MKIRAVGAELFHADGQTDGQTVITKLIVAILWKRLKPTQLLLYTGDSQTLRWSTTKLQLTISEYHL